MRPSETQRDSERDKETQIESERLKESQRNSRRDRETQGETERLRESLRGSKRLRVSQRDSETVEKLRESNRESGSQGDLGRVRVTQRE